MNDRRGTTWRRRCAGQRLRQRGAILFEVLLSIAVFAGAALFVLSASRSAVDGQYKSLHEQQAVDLASSLLAELEAGQMSLLELRDGLPRQLGSNESFREQIDERIARGGRGWAVEIATERSEYPGLTLVILTVFETQPGEPEGGDASDAAVRCTLRQLMRLRDADVEEVQPDEMLEDLPSARGGLERAR